MAIEQHKLSHDERPWGSGMTKEKLLKERADKERERAAENVEEYKQLKTQTEISQSYAVAETTTDTEWGVEWLEVDIKTKWATEELFYQIVHWNIDVAWELQRRANETKLRIAWNIAEKYLNESNNGRRQGIIDRAA